MTVKIFLDSNLWIYTYDNRDPSKQNITRQLILQNADHIVISTQILGEIYHVLTRKKLQPPNQIAAIMQDLMDNFQPIAIDVAQVRKAIALQSTTQYSYWDKPSGCHCHHRWLPNALFRRLTTPKTFRKPDDSESVSSLAIPPKDSEALRTIALFRDGAQRG